MIGNPRKLSVFKRGCRCNFVIHIYNFIVKIKKRETKERKRKQKGPTDRLKVTPGQREATHPIKKVRRAFFVCCSSHFLSHSRHVIIHYFSITNVKDNARQDVQGVRGVRCRSQDWLLRGKEVCQPGLQR